MCVPKGEGRSKSLRSLGSSADQRLFILNEEDHARFEEILQAPPTDDPKLRKLFERPSPFGTHINLTAPRTSDQ